MWLVSIFDSCSLNFDFQTMHFFNAEIHEYLLISFQGFQLVFFQYSLRVIPSETKHSDLTVDLFQQFVLL